MLSLVMAWRGLGANKLRSFLTMLGVIIGVGAVIIAVAIGQGSRQAVAESIRRLGTNVLTVFPGQQRRGGVSMGSGTQMTLTLKDADAILQSCPSVSAVSPGVDRSAQVKYRDRNTNVRINGTGPSYPEISNHPVQEGRYFTESDLKSRRRVAVLGSETCKELFDRQSPINKQILVKGSPFIVIGRLREKGGMGWRNPDEGVYVPVTTAMYRLFGMDNVGNITVQARRESLMERAQDEVTELLRRRHNLSGNSDEDFRVFNQADITATQNEQQDTFSSLITYLAIVSLFVGGIGIMNIMLVSVTERTREIGVRKAIGAKRRDILSQFLLEALILSLTGGLLGVAFGIGGSRVVGTANGWPIVLEAQTILLAFSFSAVVGVFFGFYPALKASKLNPIEALRYE
ncbi:MAG: ABC transporter permease [Chthonomonadales bacterium]|nr:ABC transporter permease [Chthonomonadales bacterium]